MNPAGKSVIVEQLHGTEIGEFFGASLAVGDLDNDGLDDLLVGAPHWGQDNGKVYIYFGTEKEQFETVVFLQGTTEGGYFGYAIASGDLDADGFDGTFLLITLNYFISYDIYYFCAYCRYYCGSTLGRFWSDLRI